VTPSSLRSVAARLSAGRRLLAGPLAVLALGFVAFASFVTFGGTSSAAPSQVSTNPATIAAGEYLFDAHCSSCHGPNGVGSTRAPELINAGAAAADFYLTTGRMPLNAANNEPLSNSPYFTPAQIRQVVSYVAALPRINGQPSDAGPGIPSILPLCPASADNKASESSAERSGAAKCVTLSFGQQTFSLNCAQCHQIVGSGGIVSKGNIVPSLKYATEQQVTEAVRIGPKPMPIFGPGQLDEVQISALAHYVQYLHRPDTRGGLAISTFGPVAEGFVGILFGFFVLLFAARMFGARR
jgi:ubiquinol-cytochrome c reductase cytochrome c subunit